MLRTGGRCESILNIGCGKDIYGDVRADLFRSKTTHVICDAHFLSFKDECFDEVYSRNLLEHLQNPLNALQEQKRVLKSGGKIVLITDHAAYWRHQLRISAHIDYGRAKRGRKTDAHYAIYFPEHLLNFFDALGMNVIGSSYVSSKWGGITGAISSLLTRFRFLRHLAYDRLKIVAQKP